jgi:hypothetical protein
MSTEPVRRPKPAGPHASPEQSWQPAHERAGSQHIEQGSYRSAPPLPSRAGKPVLSNLYIAAGLAMAVGVFMPWVKLTAPIIGNMTFSGMDKIGGIGTYVLALGLGVSLLGILVRNPRFSPLWVAPAAALLSATAGALVAYVWVQISQGMAEAQAVAPTIGNLDLGDLFSLSQGVGLFIVLAGVAVGIGTGCSVALRRRA